MSPMYCSWGLRLKVMERIQTVPQLYQALSSKEYTAELTRTMKPETRCIRCGQSRARRAGNICSV